MSRNLFFGTVLIGAVLLTHPTVAAAAAPEPEVGISVLKKGDGDTAVRHSQVTVHYTGWLTDGTKFDSSHDRGEPIQFTLGMGQVIAGWDRGLEGMKTGGKRTLMIPPSLGYGQRGAGGVIPPNATLKFEVELVAAVPPKYENIDNAQLKELLARGVKMVDVRRVEEWQQTGVVAGSRKLTAFDGRGQFNRDFPSMFQEFVGPDEEIIVICRVGNRSAVVSQMLTQQAGYTKVYNVTEGIMDWIAADNPVVK